MFERSWLLLVVFPGCALLESTPTDPTERCSDEIIDVWRTSIPSCEPPEYANPVSQTTLFCQSGSDELNLYPRIDGDTISQEITVPVGLTGRTIAVAPIDELFHVDCLDGLQGDLTLQPASAGEVTYTPGNPATLSISEPGTHVLSIPAELNVRSVSASGCGERVENETLVTAFELTVHAVEHTWSVVGCDSGVAMDGGLLQVDVMALDADGNVVQPSSTPLVELVGTGVQFSAPVGQRHLRLEGTGTIDVRHAGRTLRTIEVVSPSEVTSVDLELLGDGELLEDEAMLGHAQLGWQVVARRGADAICTTLPQDSLTFVANTPVICGVEPLDCPVAQPVNLAAWPWALDSGVCSYTLTTTGLGDGSLSASASAVVP